MLSSVRGAWWSQPSCCSWAALALCVFVVQTVAASIDLFVSPAGSDDASADGSLDRPFLTLTRAKQEVRALKEREGNSESPINVYLRGGRYALTETLDFTSEDSGQSAEAAITYQAYCDPLVEAAAISRRAFPYHSHMTTPPRLLWNGVGDADAWTGPVDPFAQMGVNVSANSVEVVPVAAQDVGTDIGSVCVDKNDGVGHTCYAEGGPMATCVSGCMMACQHHIERKVYSTEFYAEFSHLFGKDLRKEEDCVEICSSSCRGCEKVTLSGSKLLPAGALSSWTLDHSITHTAPSGESETLSVFRADMSSVLPVLSEGNVPGKPEDFATFTTLFLDDVQLPRAGYPDCVVSSGSSPFECSYASVAAVDTADNTLAYNVTTFSSRVAQWTNVPEIQLDLRPQRTQTASARYSLATVDSAAATLSLGPGGSELSYEVFTHGPHAASSSSVRFDPAARVENVLKELDSPGEWFFDVESRFLYLIPLDSATTTATTLANSVLEIPLLHQLVRVSGSRENSYVQPTHAHTTLEETTSLAKASHLRFRHLTFSGTQLHHLNVYERIPGSAWPMTRVAALYVESVADAVIEHCSFQKIGGNAILVSGESDEVQLVNNNVSFLGGSGIVVLARRGLQHNSFGSPVLSRLLVSRNVNISHNQIYHFGQQVAHAAAIMVVGAQQTHVHGNLIFGIPNNDTSSSALFPGTAYHIANANGANYYDGAPLIRAITNLDIVDAIPTTLAQDLTAQYEVAVPLVGFDIPTVAKLVGAPECRSGSGRVGSLYGELTPFTYTSCSGCCSVHDNFARLRVAGSDVAWDDATSREVVVRPGEAIELAASASAFFSSAVDVYLGFHVVTPNQILELPHRAKWQIRTRSCVYAEQTYQAECSGPCSCGNSNLALHRALSSTLACSDGFEADPTSQVCTGPFEALGDCDGSGAAISHLYYNCKIDCFATTCT